MMLFVATALLGVMLSTEVFAADSVSYAFIPKTYQNNSGPSYEVLDKYADMASLRSVLDSNLKACKERFDLSGYKIPLSEIDSVALYIYKDIPEAFHVEGMGYSTAKSYVSTLYVEYNMNQTEYEAALEKCRAVAKNMLTGLDAAGLTETDKALILHDRLAVHNEYDISHQAPYTFEMYGALINRTSVCEGYAKAYSYLLDQVGITNYYCTSDLLNHGWNIVYIDGIKYHVDVTWDDPLYDQTGYVRHTNFLRSTTGIIATDHVVGGAIDFDHTPSDTRFDSAEWQKSETAFQLLNGQLYYVNSYNQKLMKLQDGADAVVADVSDTWYTGEGNWGGGFQMLSSDGVDLLFSKSTAVYRYCTETGATEKVWSPTMASGFRIFGFAYEDGYLICDTYSSPNFLENTKKLYQVKQAYTPHAHACKHSYDNACDTVCNDCGAVRTVLSHVYDNACDTTCNECGQVRSTTHLYSNACDASCNTCGATRTPPHLYSDSSDADCNLCGADRPARLPGDLDGNGLLEISDAIYLLFHVNFEEDYPVNQAVDYDGNGQIEIADAIYLLFHVNFEDDYPLH